LLHRILQRFCEVLIGHLEVMHDQKHDAAPWKSPARQRIATALVLVGFAAYIAARWFFDLVDGVFFGAAACLSCLSAAIGILRWQPVPCALGCAFAGFWMTFVMATFLLLAKAATE
jgi:hypothetical protein